MTQGFVYSLSSANAGGSDTEIQYNNSGVIDGDSGFTTDGAGNVTGVSVAFSDNTKGIVGTTTNDDAGAGYVGEYISSIVLSGSPVSLTTTVSANVTSISLTAGDWDVYGQIYFSGTATDTSGFSAGITATSATMPSAASLTDAQSLSIIQNGTGFPTAGQMIVPTIPARVSLSGTTTYYLVAACAFLGGTAGAAGTIRARRVR